jgi:hypothetical protein
MNAFVKTTNGNFPNANFYYAWKGLTELQYQVIKFEEEDLDTPEFLRSIMGTTPVFAGVTVFDKILELKNVKYEKIDTYPKILHPFLNREVKRSTIGEFRKEWDVSEDRPIKFMKPVAQKKFNGAVMKSILNWIPLAELPDDTEVYLSDPVKFISEYRIYVRDQRILTGKHYSGDWTVPVDRSVVESVIKSMEPEAPCAYSVDFGVLDNGKTSLVEFNDATSLGNYGLDSTRYAEMISARWTEIWEKGKQ